MYMLVELILKALLCCSLNKTAPTNLYDENDIIAIVFECTSSLGGLLNI